MAPFQGQQQQQHAHFSFRHKSHNFHLVTLEHDLLSFTKLKMAITSILPLVIAVESATNNVPRMDDVFQQICGNLVSRYSQVLVLVLFPNINVLRIGT